MQKRLACHEGTRGVGLRRGASKRVIAASAHRVQKVRRECYAVTAERRLRAESQRVMSISFGQASLQLKIV